MQLLFTEQKSLLPEKRQPYFSVGSFLPKEICLILPIEISFSLNSKLLAKDADYIEEERKWPTSLEVFNFDITVSNSTETFRFPVRNARLVSRNRSIQASNVMEVKSNYLGYYGL